MNDRPDQPERPHEEGSQPTEPVPAPPPQPEPGPHPSGTGAPGPMAGGGPSVGTPATPQSRPSAWDRTTSRLGGGGMAAVVIAAVVVAGLILILAGGLVTAFVLRNHDHTQRAGQAWSGQAVPGPERRGNGGSPGLGRGDGMPGRPGGGLGRGLGGGLEGLLPRGLGSLGSALHGQVTVQEGSGTTVLLVQRGQVTSLSDTSMTVRSTDGFTATYTIGDASQRRLRQGASTLSKGDSVLVVADKDSSTTRFILKTGVSSS